MRVCVRIRVGEWVFDPRFRYGGGEGIHYKHTYKRINVLFGGKVSQTNIIIKYKCAYMCYIRVYWCNNIIRPRPLGIHVAFSRRRRRRRRCILYTAYNRTSYHYPAPPCIYYRNFDVLTTVFSLSPPFVMCAIIETKIIVLLLVTLFPFFCPSRAQM